MEHLKLILTQAQQNLFFLLMVAGISLVIYCVSYGAQVLIDHQSHMIKCNTFGTTTSTRRIAAIGMFSAISVILMYFEFPLPFLAPGFYKLDFSEIPVLICGFAFGPAAGVIPREMEIPYSARKSIALLCSAFSCICTAISRAFFSLIPLISARRSGSSSMIFSVSAPNFFTILAASADLMPRITPELKYRSIAAASWGTLIS